MATLQKTKDFAKFDPEWYMANYIASEEASISMRTDLDALYKIFTQYNISGKRLLDVGTGPTIHSVITASNHVDEIFLSDFAQPNLDYLEKWLKGEKPHPKMMIDYVNHLEGRTVTAEQRENEIREMVKGILPIDVASEQPLGSDYDGAKFDVIISSYCFGVVATDVAGYQKCLENVSSLLNKGGHMIVAVCLEGESYRVGEYMYPALTITREQMDSVMVNTGYDVITSIEIKGNEDDAKYLDFNSYYYIVGRK